MRRENESNRQCDRYRNQQASDHQNERSPNAEPAPEEDCSSDEADDGECRAKARRHPAGGGISAVAGEQERGCNDEVKANEELTDDEEDACHRASVG